MAWLRARPLLALCLLGALLSGVGLSNQLWTPDEPRVAAIGRAMWETGDLAVPRLDGEPFLEKPPLYWWVQVFAFALAGHASPLLARLPSALFGFGTLCCTWVLGRRSLPPEACLLAGLVLLTTAELALTLHWVLVDPALLFGVTACLAGFARSLDLRGAARGVALAAGYAGAAVALLAKGVVGLGIPALGFGVYLLWSRRLRSFVGWHLLLGAAFCAAVMAGWLVRVDAVAGREAVKTFLVYNQLGRFLPDQGGYVGGHVRPFWYYLTGIPVWWLPWFPFLVLCVLALRRSFARLDAGVRDALRLYLSTTLPVLLVLSLAATKRGLYLEPILPPASLALGAWMALPVERAAWEARVERGVGLVLCAAALFCVVAVFAPRPSFWWGVPSAMLLLAAAAGIHARPPVERVERHLATVLLVTLAAVHLFVTVKPAVDRYKSFTPFVRALQTVVPPPTPLFTFHPDETLLGIVNFYTGRQVRVVDAAALARLAESDHESIVLLRDRRPDGGNYGHIERSGLRHRLLSEQRIGSERTMRIVAVGGGSAVGADSGPAPGESGSVGPLGTAPPARGPKSGTGDPGQER